MIMLIDVCGCYDSEKICDISSGIFGKMVRKFNYRNIVIL